MIQTASIKYHSNDTMKEVFDWKVKDTAPVYAKVSKQKLRYSIEPIKADDYINHSRSKFVSEMKDNFRGFQPNPDHEEKSSCNLELPDYLQVSQEIEELSIAPTRASSLSIVPSDTRMRTQASSCEDHIAIIDQKAPDRSKISRPKTVAKKKPLPESVLLEEPMTRFLSNSAFNKKFNKPLFAPFSSSATQKIIDSSKTLTNTIKKLPVKKQLSRANFPETLLRIESERPEIHLAADLKSAELVQKFEVARPRNFDLFTTKIISKKSDKVQPRVESSFPIKSANLNTRGKSDLFRSSRDNIGPLNIFSQEPLCSSRARGLPPYNF